MIKTGSVKADLKRQLAEIQNLRGAGGGGVRGAGEGDETGLWAFLWGSSGKG